jgi:hypothetical protein
MIVSFNEPTTTIYTRQRLLDGFFAGIHIGLISQPIIYRLPGTFWTAVAMSIVNPVVYEHQTPSMERTLEFGYGQTDRPSPLGPPFIHWFDGLTLPFVLTRASRRFNRDQLPDWRLKLNPWHGSCQTFRIPTKILVKDTSLLQYLRTCMVSSLGWGITDSDVLPDNCSSRELD